MDSGRTLGGILKLRELIEEHPAELAYDFRTRFGLSYEDIGDRVSWLEACYLVAVLIRDPSSWVQTTITEWKHPVSREWIVASHIFDLLAQVNSKNKPKPYPTPWPAEGSNRIGRTSNRSSAEVIALLDRMNPKET